MKKKKGRWATYPRPRLPWFGRRPSNEEDLLRVMLHKVEVLGKVVVSAIEQHDGRLEEIERRLEETERRVDEIERFIPAIVNRKAREEES